MIGSMAKAVCMRSQRGEARQPLRAAYSEVLQPVIAGFPASLG